MSALLVVRADGRGDAQRLRDQARASLSAQGFGQPRECRFSAGSVHWFPTPGNPGSQAQFQSFDEGGGFVACVGTLFYRDRTGASALRELWRDFSTPEAFAWDTLWGNYLLVLGKGGETWAFGDPVGMVKLYHTRDRSVWSTSWLACAACASSAEVDRIGAIDYVLSGANHGERTALADVRIADPARAVELSTLATRALTVPEQWSDGPRFETMAAAVDAAASILTARARAIGEGFDERIRTALSGGFDSRLIVASLRAAGTTPRLHVYGSAGDDDVRVARRAAQAIGLPLEHVDKEELNRAMPPAGETLFREQSLFFDGLPIDGIFDRGADRQTMIWQNAGGCVALNGGGGEILRNFFYLHDRPFSASQIVQAFYSNWPARVIASTADRRDYRNYLIDSIERSLGATGALSRSQVELIYPLFRVRYWTSRTNSIAVRSGHFLTPLVDPAMVRLSQSLPLAWKDYGRFEAALLARLDPALAAVPLSYGFTPAQGPTLSYRLSMWIQHRRPPWMRAQLPRLKARVRRQAAAFRSGTVTVGSDDPSRSFAACTGIAPHHLQDAGQATRARTLEFVVKGIAAAQSP